MIPSIARLLSRLGHCRRGATAVEYGLILSLVFLAMLAGFRSTATATTDLWSGLNNKVQAAR